MLFGFNIFCFIFIFIFILFVFLFYYFVFVLLLFYFIFYLFCFYYYFIFLTLQYVIIDPQPEKPGGASCWWAPSPAILSRSKRARGPTRAKVKREPNAAPSGAGDNNLPGLFIIFQNGPPPSHEPLSQAERYIRRPGKAPWPETMGLVPTGLKPNIPWAKMATELYL